MIRILFKHNCLSVCSTIIKVKSTMSCKIEVNVLTGNSYNVYNTVI